MNILSKSSFQSYTKLHISKNSSIFLYLHVLTANISVLQCTLTYIHIWTYLILCTTLSLYIWLKTEADLSKQRMYAWKATTWRHFYIDKNTSIWLFELILLFNICIVSRYRGRALCHWYLAQVRLWTRIG